MVGFSLQLVNFEAIKKRLGFSVNFDFDCGNSNRKCQMRPIETLVDKTVNKKRFCIHGLNQIFGFGPLFLTEFDAPDKESEMFCSNLRNLSYFL